MQDGIGTGGDAFDANLSGRWMEQREQFGRPVLRVFMGLFPWFAFRLPMMARIRDRLRGTGFILCPDRPPLLLSYGGGLLEEFF